MVLVLITITLHSNTYL